MDYAKKICALCLFAFSCMGFAEPQIAAGSKTAYHFDSKYTYTPAPDGYDAFYIDHVGRHGSRYISKSKYEDIAYQTLLIAESKGQLTHLGKDLLDQISRIAQLNKGHYGALTDLGRQNIRLISQRMLDNYPTVFKGQKIEVISSSSPRAKETANIFVEAFHSKYPQINVTQQQEDQQTLLRFFEYSPVYKEFKQSKKVKNAVKSIENMPDSWEMGQHFLQRIFSDEFIHKYLDKGLEIKENSSIKSMDFVIAVYQLYQESLSFSPQLLAEHHVDLNSFFHEDEKTQFNNIVTVKNYLQIGPAFDANGIQIKIAAPLLWDMLNTADIAIKNNNIDANLRFAHAETVSPLATLLEIEGTATVANSILQYPLVWQADKIIPMMANIQWIFYKSKKADQPILVKVLLNEQEVHLPIKTEHYPYYNWDDVKQFYLTKLNKLGLSPQSSAIDMLKNLR